MCNSWRHMYRTHSIASKLPPRTHPAPSCIWPVPHTPGAVSVRPGSGLSPVLHTPVSVCPARQRSPPRPSHTRVCLSGPAASGLCPVLHTPVSVCLSGSGLSPVPHTPVSVCPARQRAVSPPSLTRPCLSVRPGSGLCGRSCSGTPSVDWRGTLSSRSPGSTPSGRWQNAASRSAPRTRRRLSSSAMPPRSSKVRRPAEEGRERGSRGGTLRCEVSEIQRREADVA